MAERLRGALAALLALAACGDDEAGDEGAATGALTEAQATEAAPTSTDAPPPATTGETGDASGSSGVGEDDSSGDASGTTGSVEEPEGQFVAVGDGGRRARSVDGETWEALVGTGLLDTDEETAAPDALRALAVGDGYVIAVGGGGNFFVGNSMVMRSTDGGTTWQEDLLLGKPDYAQHKLYGVAASGQQVVAVGMRGKRIRSADGGVTWEDVSFEDTLSRLLGVAASGSTFVVVGWTEDAYDAPKTSAITVSADGGATWGPVDESWPRLDAVAAGGGVFVAVGATACVRSTDGAAWADCGLGLQEFVGVSHAGGEFVVVTAGGLSTSADGLTWSAPEMPALGGPKQIAHGNGRYVGVRWTDRGWAEALADWSFVTHATEPLRAVVFVPTP
jgi:hypothetical protein